MNGPSIPSIEHKRISVPLDDVSRNGSFSGYASLFGKVDMGKDKVERGAFSRSLKKRGSSGVRMLFQHDPAEPIGTWESIREDAKGLFVRGRILGGSAKGAEVLNLMREGAIDGLSIGFRTERSRTDRKTGVRSILEADLWEISIVTFPMLPQARVEQVKASSLGQAKQNLNPLPSVREFERWLTRDAGLTRNEAKVIIAKGFNHLAGRRDAAVSNGEQLVQRLHQATQQITSHLN